VGYGHLCKPDHPPITETEAEFYLAQDLMTALTATLRYCPVLATESESRLAAIVDFTFNLGAGRLQTSTLRRRINQREWSCAAQELRRWVYGGGQILPGLVARRAGEIRLLS
jgi:lysozyme